MQSVSSWLKLLNLEQYSQVFADNDVDLDVLRILGDKDLQDLGVSFGHRKKFLKAISELNGAEAIQLAPGPATASTAGGERRQLTVLFCDMVGFTALSERLDPEELRELMRAYRKTCSEVVTRYEGHVAQHLGDGVMAYFGWPLAHEDDAERALHAALEIVQVVKHVESSATIQVRIGIATGTVVVGQSGEEGADAKLAVGDTPNVAARLQGLAGTDEIVISPATRRLLGSAFELTDLGERALKGIAEPVRVWRVEAASRLPTRFEQAHGVERLTPLVGREEELALLLRRWAHVKEGEGQLVLIEGQPGIGKSRLTQAFSEHLASEPHTVLRYQCSAFHQNSALYPSIEQLEYAAGFARGDSVEQKLDKLEAVLAETAEEVAQTAPLFAALLSLPLVRYTAFNLSPQKQKEKTLGALVGQIEALARRQPVLIIYEDVHWIDATSQEALDLLVPQLQQLPVMLLVTYRPEFRARWQGKGHAHVSTLGLNRMSRRQASELVARMTGQRSLPEEVLTQILVKTDGVPLFVEELTKTVLESGLLQDIGDRFELKGVLPPLAIPSTLRDSLIARLDRLAPVKEIAQIGACIGREFSYSLLERVAAVPGEPLMQGLQQLVDAGLIFRKGTPPAATYTFKHALVQDAAYDSLLKAKRQQLHAQIAQVLEQEFANIVTNGPELLARHFTQAALNERAVPYWVAAGQRALSRMALPEAIGHLKTALALIAHLPPSPERDAQELDLRLMLSTAYVGHAGWHTTEILQTLAPARDVAARLGSSERLLSILFHTRNYHVLRGEFTQAFAVVEEMHALGRSSGDSSASLVGNWFEAEMRCWRGDFSDARRLGDAAIALYDPKKHAPLVHFYNQDPKCSTLVWAGLWLWALGFPDQARETAEENLRLARQIGHTWNLVWVLAAGDFALTLRGDVENAMARLDEALAIAGERGLSFLQAIALWHYGLARIAGTDYEQGYAEATAGSKVWEDSGGLISVPIIIAERAKALLGLGRLSEARTLVDEALQLTDRVGERVWEAETHRVSGLIALAASRPDMDSAEKAFSKSLDIARAQQARGWELRTATSYARLMQAQGHARAARELLQPIYDWFTEGFDTRDLVDARKLLGELR